MAVAPTPIRPARTTGTHLSTVARLVGGQVECDVVVHGVSLDSRQVLRDDLYAALPGQRAHGADHAAQALAAGAAAILTDAGGAARLGGVDVPVLVASDPRAVLGDVAAEIYGRPADALQMIGVTGTNGKTTTAYLVESALRQLGRHTGLIGTVETRMGTVRMPAVRTTPEATDLMAILAAMREGGVATVVMEVSSHALAQHRVDGIVYDVAAFTNLSQDHLDFHEDMESYFRAKAQLFTPARAVRGVVCVGDPWGHRLATDSAIPVEVLRTAPDARGAGLGEWAIRTVNRPDFELVGPGGRLALRSALPGEFNIANTALAALVLLAAGVAVDEVVRGLAADPAVPGRMQRVEGGGGDAPLVVVDYAHTPEAVHAAVGALRGTTDGRLLVVLGAGGDRDSGKRTAMGAAAAADADVVIVTDDNPRSEDPAAIRAAVRSGAVGSTSVQEIADRADAIAAAIDIARVGDTVLVLGKGHEKGQEVAGVVHPFDDVAACRAALQGRSYRPGESS